MTTSLQIHNVVQAAMKRESNNGSHWIMLTLIDDKGERCEITLFHDSTLRVDADANTLREPYRMPQTTTWSALPRPGSEASA